LKRRSSRRLQSLDGTETSGGVEPEAVLCGNFVPPTTRLEPESLADQPESLADLHPDNATNIKPPASLFDQAWSFVVLTARKRDLIVAVVRLRAGGTTLIPRPLRPLRQEKGS
jgi:hypothetical protein